MMWRTATLRGVAVRVSGEIDDPKVHAQKTLREHRRFFGRVERHQQIEGALDQHQIGLPPRSMELDPLVVAHLHRHDFTPVQGGQTHGFEPLKGQDTLVIDHRAIRTEGHALGFIPFIGFYHFRNSANSQLG